MRLSIFELAGGKKTVLAGAPVGKNLFAKAIPVLGRSPTPTPLFLDFKAIEVVTASFVREGILGIRDYCRNSDSNLYPVIANADETVTEEIEIELRHRGEAFVSCKLDQRGKVSSIKRIGVLDEKHALTLEAVQDLKQADAATLLERFKHIETIGITGWNNRLSALVSKGLLVETKRGKTKFYHPVLESN
jgi:hypothetical protein